MSKNFGYVRIEQYMEVGRFLDQMTFDSAEEAVAWLEKNAGGVWGKGVKVGGGEEWGGGGVWLFQNQMAGQEGTRVAVRRLDERDRAESDYWVEKIAQVKEGLGIA
jgi:hypothetical protein